MSDDKIVGIDAIRWHDYEFLQPNYPDAPTAAYETLLIRGRRGYVFWKPSGYWWSYFGEFEDEGGVFGPFATPDDAKHSFALFYEEHSKKTPEQIMQELEQSYRDWEESRGEQ